MAQLLTRQGNVIREEKANEAGQSGYTVLYWNITCWLLRIFLDWASHLQLQTIKHETKKWLPMSFAGRPQKTPKTLSHNASNITLVGLKAKRKFHVARDQCHTLPLFSNIRICLLGNKENSLGTNHAFTLGLDHVQMKSELMCSSSTKGLTHQFRKVTYTFWGCLSLFSSDMFAPGAILMHQYTYHSYLIFSNLLCLTSIVLRQIFHYLVDPIVQKTAIQAISFRVMTSSIKKNGV